MTEPYALAWPYKDPNENEDFSLDWTDHLDAGDAISTSAWAITYGDGMLNKGVDSKTSTTTTVWLSGGTVDQVYVITNTIVTVGGRTMEQSAKFRVTDL